MDAATISAIAQLVVMLVSPAQMGHAVTRPVKAIHCHIKHNCPARAPRPPKEKKP